MAQGNVKKQMSALVAVIALLAALFGMWTFYNTHEQKGQPFKLENGYVLPNAQHLQDFKLTSDQGKNFDLQQLKGYWNFVFFGFSHCQKICPASLSRLNKMYKQLKQAGANPMPRVIFVSIDPERDTPKVLHQYLQSFNKHFIGLTGSKQAVKTLSQQFNVLYTKVQKQNGDYTVDHSGTLMLVDPRGKLMAMFRQPLEPEALARDYMKVARYYQKHVHKHSIETP